MRDDGFGFSFGVDQDVARLVFLGAEMGFQFVIFLLQLIVADRMVLGIVLHERTGQHRFLGQFGLLDDLRILVYSGLFCCLRQHFEIDHVVEYCLLQCRGVRLTLCRRDLDSHVHASLRNGNAIHCGGSFVLCKCRVNQQCAQ